MVERRREKYNRIYISSEGAESAERKKKRDGERRKYLSNMCKESKNDKQVFYTRVN